MILALGVARQRPLIFLEPPPGDQALLRSGNVDADILRLAGRVPDSHFRDDALEAHLAEPADRRPPDLHRLIAAARAAATVFHRNVVEEAAVFIASSDGHPLRSPIDEKLDQLEPL